MRARERKIAGTPKQRKIRNEFQVSVGCSAAYVKVS